MSKLPAWIDDNWRRFWWAHLLHFAQGGFTAALLADGWLVAACLLFSGYLAYQVVEFYRQRDTIVRDVKIYQAGLYAGLIGVFTTGWSLSKTLEGIL